MKFILPSHRPLKYTSVHWLESQVFEGVWFGIKRISLLNRLELAKRIREITIENEFLRAGEVQEKVQASINDLVVNRLLLEWGLVEITGLKIDGEDPTCELLLDKGPDTLSNEIIAAIQAEAGLSDDERKNS